MKVINITILALLLVGLSAADIFAIHDPAMPDSIRVGNLDGSPILANIGDTSYCVARSPHLATTAGYGDPTAQKIL